MPVGLEVTVPPPLPASMTVRVKTGPGSGSGSGSGPGAGSVVCVPPVAVMTMERSSANGADGQGCIVTPATQLTPAAVTGPEYCRLAIQPPVSSIRTTLASPAVRNDSPSNLPSTTPVLGGAVWIIYVPLTVPVSWANNVAKNSGRSGIASTLWRRIPSERSIVVGLGISTRPLKSRTSSTTDGGTGMTLLGPVGELPHPVAPAARNSAVAARMRGGVCTLRRERLMDICASCGEPSPEDRIRRVRRSSTPIDRLRVKGVRLEENSCKYRTAVGRVVATRASRERLQNCKGVRRECRRPRQRVPAAAGYRVRKVMKPRVMSYGDTPTVTRSPGTTLIRNRRILPLNCASTSWPGSHSTRYMPPLCTAVTMPCTSIRSLFAKCTPCRKEPESGTSKQFLTIARFGHSCPLLA